MKPEWMLRERLISLKMFLKSAQNQSLSSEITREALTKSAVLYQSFFNRNWPQEFPQNRPFFLRICPWKPCEIWRFFPRPTRSPDNRSRRYASFNSICPYYKRETEGGCSFAVSAARLWNNVPLITRKLESVKSLKTNLFNTMFAAQQRLEHFRI